MKKILLIIAVIAVTACCAFAAKYKVNTSGVVNSNGVIISSPSNYTNQNYYNNYSAQSYVTSNQVNSNQTGIVEIVMDYSGSMSNWISVAKKSMSAIVSQIPSSTMLGFRVFGHDNYGNNPSNNNTLGDVKKIVKKGNKFSVVASRCLGSTSGACSATQQVASIQRANSYALLSGMNSVNIGGATPLVYALDRTVYQDFNIFDKVTPKKIVLITDGGENCGGDPCAFARSLMNKRSDVHIDVVLVSSSSTALSCLSTTTGGHFYTTNDLSNFSTVLNKSIQSAPSVMTKTKKQKYEFVN